MKKLLILGFLVGMVAPLRGGEVYQRLREKIDPLWLVDTHEHLGSEENYLRQPPDFLRRMLHYADSDLISAGLPRTGDHPVQLGDTQIPLPERWRAFMEYWPLVRFTGYGRALHAVVQDIYGMDLNQITPETCGQLNQIIADANTPGLYQRVLKDKAHIEHSIVDIGQAKVDRQFFSPVLRFDDFITAKKKKDLDAIAGRTGVPINRLEDYVRALETAFDQAVQQNIVGIKSGLAYSRRIYYPRPAEAEARAVFENMLNDAGRAPAGSLALENYMMHQICRLAGKHKLPFQIHTGLQTGSGNLITNSKPTDLVNLIQEYPGVKFVIFHGGYPYGPELATMAKNFPNVYLDMCWLHIISPTVSRHYLAEWLDTVPCNKIMGFGGDYLYVEGAYAHAQMAREVVASVLAEKVIAGEMTEAEAFDLARRILRTNAIELYHLPLAK